jgi:hypothetical protein
MMRKPEKSAKTHEKRRSKSEDKESANAERKATRRPKAFDLHSHLANLQRQMGTLYSTAGQGPGDVAWRGPCEGGTQMVCRFDRDMLPTDCKPEPCAAEAGNPKN